MATDHGKRYNAAVKDLDRKTPRPVEEAVTQIKERATAKFDETVELSLKLNIDTKQSDQLVRGSFSLPHGTGKSVRVIAFVEGEEAEAAKSAGAIEVGGEDLAKKIQDGWMDFDVAVAHPSMMRFVGRLGKVLGPKGLMPSPKSGTVTDKVGQAVQEFSAGKIEFRNDKEGNLHLIVGKASFEAEKLAENIRAAIRFVESIRPQAVKGDYIQCISVATTMGPGLRIAV